jgi:general secretion pathway protein A
MYNSYFGFLESPFSVTPDPRFFYSNPIYQEAYANLRYGIEAKKGFIVITGEVGTGKTTLLRKLLSNLEDTVHSAFIFNTDLSFPELLQLTLHDLGLAPKEASKVTMLQELNDYLIKQLNQDHTVAALIDEAQNLSDDALEGLRLLSNMETDQKKLIQIVLMGQPEFQATLDRPGLRQLKQRIALQCRLAPLKNEEVRPYIDFRLRAAGYNGNDLFDAAAVRRITLYSNGIPRLVNIICDNALLSAFAKYQKSISAEMIDGVARDLRSGSQGQPDQPATISPVLASMNRPETTIGAAVNHGTQHQIRRTAKVVLQTFLLVVAFFAVASLIDPKNLLIGVGRGLQFARHNLQQWVLFITDQQGVLDTADAEVKLERKEQRVLIPRGSSIYKIANDTYGANASLGIDLIKESNPGIKNLNRVSAGQALLVPSLTPETLLRKQSDASYHLIVGTFHRLITAEEYAMHLRNKGYKVTIIPRRISDHLLLYRVEIHGLKTFEEANRTWSTALKNEWIVLADNGGGTN